jgi:hypothetical protein
LHLHEPTILPNASTNPIGIASSEPLRRQPY